MDISTPQAIAAIIGAGVATAGILIKDLVTPIVRAWIDHSKARGAAAERYAPPLARAAESLFYRLEEILITKRAAFLLTDSKPSAFNSYKYNSTIYRTAALLGWIWALKKEHSILADRSTWSAISIYRSISDIESAFADGASVESWRVRTLSSLWGLPIAQASEARIGAKVDAILNDAYDVDTGRADAKSLGAQQARDLIQNIVFLLASEAKIEPSPLSINNSLPQALDILSVRQSWIFRDWQSAIGELMSERLAPGTARMFDVIGFSKFEEHLSSDNRWLVSLKAMFSDLNPDKIDEREFRLAQLQAIHKAVAQLILRLNRIRMSQRYVDKKLAAAAKKTVTRYSPTPA